MSFPCVDSGIAIGGQFRKSIRSNSNAGDSKQAKNGKIAVAVAVAGAGAAVKSFCNRISEAEAGPLMAPSDEDDASDIAGSWAVVPGAGAGAGDETAAAAKARARSTSDYDDTSSDGGGGGGSALSYGVGSPTGLLQYGVMRTNCVDCLDRTNVAQFCYARVAISRQIKALGFIPAAKALEDIVTSCMKIWAEHGDAIATQYGGSGAMHKVDAEGPGGGKEAEEGEPVQDTVFVLTGGAKNALVAAKRYYSNVLSDYERQNSIDMLLGVFKPHYKDKHIWELKLRPEHLRHGRFGRRSSELLAVPATAPATAPVTAPVTAPAPATATAPATAPAPAAAVSGQSPPAAMLRQLSKGGFESDGEESSSSDGRKSDSDDEPDDSPDDIPDNVNVTGTVNNNSNSNSHSQSNVDGDGGNAGKEPELLSHPSHHKAHKSSPTDIRLALVLPSAVAGGQGRQGQGRETGAGTGAGAGAAAAACELTSFDTVLHREFDALALDNLPFSPFPAAESEWTPSVYADRIAALADGESSSSSSSSSSSVIETADKSKQQRVFKHMTEKLYDSYLVYYSEAQLDASSENFPLLLRTIDTDTAGAGAGAGAGPLSALSMPKSRLLNLLALTAAEKDLLRDLTGGQSRGMDPGLLAAFRDMCPPLRDPAGGAASAAPAAAGPIKNIKSFASREVEMEAEKWEGKQKLREIFEPNGLSSFPALPDPPAGAADGRADSSSSSSIDGASTGTARFSTVDEDALPTTATTTTTTATTATTTISRVSEGAVPKAADSSEGSRQSMSDFGKSDAKKNNSSPEKKSKWQFWSSDKVFTYLIFFW
jgi:hypothetical protein